MEPHTPASSSPSHSPAPSSPLATGEAIEALTVEIDRGVSPAPSSSHAEDEPVAATWPPGDHEQHLLHHQHDSGEPGPETWPPCDRDESLRQHSLDEHLHHHQTTDEPADGTWPRPGPVAWLALRTIRGYQRFLSPGLPPACRFFPTCSDYGYEAIAKYGIIRGGRLAAWRLLRCNPFGRGGFDPVA